MNKIEEVALEAITNGAVTVTESYNKLVEQMPELINQICAWNMSVNIFQIIISIIVVFATYKLSKFLLKRIRHVTKALIANNDYYDKEAYGFWKYVSIISVGLVYLHAFIIIIISIIDCLKIIIAPKLFLLEYVSDLIK